MNNENPTPTYSQTLARFGLNQKPVRDYHDGFFLYFIIDSGKMFCEVIKTIKNNKLPLKTFEVIDRQHLDKLLMVESLVEVHDLEIVQ